MSNHTDITDPPSSKAEETRIYFIGLDPDTGNFDIYSRLEPYKEQLSDEDIMKIINSHSKDFARTHFDFDFKKPTKIAFRLEIDKWEFSEINRYDYKTYPFYLKDESSHEIFRGLKPLPEKVPDNKTIVVYNLGMKNPPSLPSELHKYGLRINVVERDKNKTVKVLTPLEIDPEFKNEG
ncbi:MAG: hypothetical protein IH901_04990 [Proteobacteria bacterium]|nr:hypothetical protein [Pseudomonadota bacterium]